MERKDFEPSIIQDDEYININKIAEIKGLKSNRSIRLAIQKGKYIAREIKVPGGKSYEILYASLEPELQEMLEDESVRTTALVPVNNQPTFICESAKMTALARMDVITALFNLRKRYRTKKEADLIFIDLYNSQMLLPKVYRYLGNISIGTLHRWVKNYEDNGSYYGLLPQYSYTPHGEYNSKLTNEMKQIIILLF